MFGLGMTELIVIMVIALIIFGPNKLPEMGNALGKAIREFKQGADEVKRDVEAGIGLDEETREELKSALSLDQEKVKPVTKG